MAKEIRPLQRYNENTEQTEIFYPATTTDAIVHPTKRKSLTNVISDIETNNGAYDISAANSGTTYTDLSAALGTNGVNVPEAVRRGGMSIKYVQSSDNKYVQFRCKSQLFSINPKDWSCIEDLSKKSVTVVGNGDTVISNQITNQLIIGNLYRVVCSKKNWNYQGTSNKCQIYSDADNVFGATLPNSSFTDVVFIAVSNSVSIHFRADIDESVTFDVIGVFNDTVFDDYIKEKENEYPTDNPAINEIINEIFIPNYSQNSINVKTAFNADKKLQIIVKDSSSNELINLIVEENTCGIYKSGDNYIYIKKKAQCLKAMDGNLTLDVSNINNCPNISSFVFKKQTDEFINNTLVLPQSFSILGNGQTVVGKSLTGLKIGKKYTLFAPVWSCTSIDGSTNILQFYYNDGSTHIVAAYPKNYVESYIIIDFVAVVSTYNINFRGDAGTTANFILKEYDLQDNFSLINQHVINNNYYIQGNGTTVVERHNIINNLIVGEKYILFAKRWEMSQIPSDSTVIQFYYYDNSPQVVYAKLKSQMPEYIVFEFIAQNPVYNINLRGDSGESACFQLKKYDGESEYELDKLKNDIIHETQSYWKGKNIAWYGTSIPAGGYPQIVGTLLGATIFNYAKGGSATVKGNTYSDYNLNLGHTIAEKVAMVKDTWTIDDSNQTFSVGPRTMGITGIPNYTTYSEVKAARLSIITSSHEIVFLVRTLLSNETERTSFLQNALGDLYTIMMAEHSSSFDYHSTDLWIIDHGHNDDCRTNPETIDMSQMNLTSFVGAMNTYINMIYQYKPHARIVLVSDYDDWNPDTYNVYSKKYTIETQQMIADRWHLPIIRIDKYLPFNINVTIRTKGYWDANAVWHDDGFVWGALSGNMIGNGHFNDFIIKDYGQSSRPARTIEELAEILQPTQDADGNYWYTTNPRYSWIFDGLHPHSVADGHALQMYAEPLAELLKEVGTNGY